MRVVLVSSLVLVIAACGGSERGQSVCDNQVPPPPECMTACNAQPGAPTTCPAGYHCTPDGTCDAFCTAAGTECGDGFRCTPDGRCVGTTACVDLECDIVDCTAMSLPPTTISGTVFAPNGSLPLYGISVYVPNVPLGPPPDGAVCDRCTGTVPGYPLALTTTDDAGHFTMVNVPSGDDIPVTVSVGKWRRTITVPRVDQCVNTDLAATETRLPRDKSEGYMPKIAISTGSADALECLVRKLGIADSELTTDAQPGMLHLYTDGGSGGGEGANRFRSGFAGGSGNFSDSTTLWDNVDKLKQYDIVILSCEGGQHPETKSQAAMDALKAYADFGGRVFLSHWHNIWIEGSTQGGGNQRPAVWDGVATWNNSSTTFTGIDTIDEINNPKGPTFATWMLNVMGSTVRDQIPIVGDTGKQTCTSVVSGRGERWVYWEPMLGGAQYPQMFQFTTPNETPANRCGKVVFSDMHVSGDSGSDPGTPYPDSCATSALTAQEKALAFMFFDIASCVSTPVD